MNKIFYEDCLTGLKKLDDKSVNLIVTSPPYADTTHYGKNVTCFDTKNYNDWFLPILSELSRVMKDDASFILNINDKIDNGFRSTYVYDLICRIVNETDLKLYERYFWYKKSALPTGGEKRLNDKVEYLFHFTKTKQHKACIERIRIPYTDSSIKRFKTPVDDNDTIDENGLTTILSKKMLKPNENGKKPDGVFRFNTAGVLKGDSAGRHPASFHPDIPYFFITWLTDENDIVLDPFIGTGTVAQTAKKLNRQYIGFEINESYKDIINIKLSDKEISKVKFTSLDKIFSDTIDIEFFKK